MFGKDMILVTITKKNINYLIVDHVFGFTITDLIDMITYNVGPPSYKLIYNPM